MWIINILKKPNTPLDDVWKSLCTLNLNEINLKN